MNLFLILSAAADAGPFDHSHAELSAFLSGAVSDAGVDYTALKSRRSKLDHYLTTVQEADLTGWSNAQKLALYVNAYNGYTLALMLDNGPPTSITNLDGGKVWDTRTFVVAGQPMTLNQIENGQARKLADGRVHSVLNCASKGCPPLYLSALTDNNQGAALDAAAKRWAATNALLIDGDTLKLSMVFDWYSGDFTAQNQGDIPGVDGKAENAMWFLSKYVDDTTKQRLLSGSLTATFATYDWALNKR